MALNSLGIQVERHWREHRPKMVAELEADGVFRAVVEVAEQLTLIAEAEAIQSGTSPDEARELFRTHWAFLPSEEDVPDLGSDPSSWRLADAQTPTLSGWCSEDWLRALRAFNKEKRD